MTINVEKTTNGVVEHKSIEQKDLFYYQCKGWTVSTEKPMTFTPVKKGKKHTED